MSVQALKKSEGPIAETVPEANAGYLSGFGNGFETEALPGALPVGRNSPQKCPYRTIRGTTERLAIHGTEDDQRALVAVSHPSDGEPLGRVRESRHRALANRARARGGGALGADALGSDRNS